MSREPHLAWWQSGLMRKTRNLVPSGASVRIRPTSKSERNPAVSGLSLSFSFFPAPNVQEASFSFLGLSLIIPARIVIAKLSGTPTTAEGQPRRWNVRVGPHVVAHDLPPVPWGTPGLNWLLDRASVSIRSGGSNGLSRFCRWEEKVRLCHIAQRTDFHHSLAPSHHPAIPPSRGRAVLRSFCLLDSRNTPVACNLAESTDHDDFCSSLLL